MAWIKEEGQHKKNKTISFAEKAGHLAFQMVEKQGSRNGSKYITRLIIEDIYRRFVLMKKEDYTIDLDLIEEVLKKI